MAVMNDVAPRLRSTSLRLRSQHTFIRVFVKEVLGDTRVQQFVNFCFNQLITASEPMVVPGVAADVAINLVIVHIVYHSI